MKPNILISSIVLAGLLWCGVVADEIDYKFQLTSHEIKWLGEQIYSNECNANFECLTSWNSGEDFPSLGIGHFIWFRACLLYTSPSPRDATLSRMPSSA